MIWLAAFFFAYAVVATREIVRARPVLEEARTIAHYYDNGEMSNLALERLANAINRFDGEDED